MTATYPVQTRTFQVKVDLQDTVYALHINDLQDEMSAVQGVLGTTPHGTFPTVKARLDDIAVNKAPTTHDHTNRLDAPAHDVAVRHIFGGALGVPAVPSTIALGTAPDQGTGTAPARDGHAHGMPTQAALLDMLIPAGVIMPYGGTVLPAGTWLWCDGTVKATATYPNLSAALAGRYNTGGEGAGNFRVPNLLGRFPMGGSSVAAAVATGGNRDAALVTHNHPGSGVGNGTADHQHYDDHTHNTGNNGDHEHPTDPGLSWAPSWPDVIAIRATTGPFTAGTTTGWDVTFTRGETLLQNAGGHTHGTYGKNEGGYSAYTNGNPAHGHGLTVASQGGSATDANLPPYLTFNYIVKAS
jgi:microcystin-dependent protein